MCPNTWRNMQCDTRGKMKTILARDESRPSKSCKGITLPGTFCSVNLCLSSLKLVAWQQNWIAALLKWGLDIKSLFFGVFRISSTSVQCIQDHLLQPWLVKRLMINKAVVEKELEIKLKLKNKICINFWPKWKKKRAVQSPCYLVVI